MDVLDFKSFNSPCWIWTCVSGVVEPAGPGSLGKTVKVPLAWVLLDQVLDHCKLGYRNRKGILGKAPAVLRRKKFAAT